MSDLESRCLDAFPQWLKDLGSDTNAIATLLEQEVPQEVQRHAARAVNYLFKSLDLIPDGTEDLGFIDDAFVVRVSAALARAEADELSGEAGQLIERLANDAKLIEEFLGDDYRRLETFVQGLNQGAVRGRSIDDVVSDEAARADALRELKAWADSYEAPSFGRAEKNLVKLKSYLSTKLPA